MWADDTIEALGINRDAVSDSGSKNVKVRQQIPECGATSNGVRYPPGAPEVGKAPAYSSAQSSDLVDSETPSTTRPETAKYVPRHPASQREEQQLHTYLASC